MKKILIVLDGAADLGISSFGGKTPLEFAKTPNLDFFADNGRLGYMYPIHEKIVPGSDNALISMFGNDFKECKRGIYEAIGAGFELRRGDLALRINFGTIQDLSSRKVIDRRAGRTLTTNEAEKLCESLNKKLDLGCKFEIKSTVQHRGVLVLRGGFCDNISPVDTEWSKPGEKSQKFEFVKSLDDDENCKYTANVLNNFISQAFEILNNHPINLERKKKGLLPANMVFMRGAGAEKQKLKPYKSWMSINSMPLEIGIAKLSGMKNFSFEMPSMKKIDVYDHLYATLNKEIKFAIKTLKRNHKDFSGCYIQFKETDLPGHDNKPYEKKNMLEIIDKKFFSFLKKMVEKQGWRVVVTCDHSTPCKLKSHSAHPVPVLVYDGENFDDMTKFNEKQAKAGDLGKMYGREFIKRTGLDG
jgi:2,3-bisphosphoglycerate-independent phosphoglycerate mutase